MVAKYVERLLTVQACRASHAWRVNPGTSERTNERPVTPAASDRTLRPRIRAAGIPVGDGSPEPARHRAPRGPIADVRRSRIRRDRRRRRAPTRPAWDPARAKTPAGFDTIDFAVAEIAAGRAVVVVDDEDRENEGDLIFAAELATPELVAFTVRYSSGVICVALTGADCDRLDLPPMYRVNQDRKGTAFTVSWTPGRASPPASRPPSGPRRSRLLADPATTARRPDPARPRVPAAGPGGRRAGPARAHRGRRRPDRLAGLRPAGALCEIVNDDGIDGPAARAAGVRPPAPAGADLHRRPDRLPAAARRCRSARSPSARLPLPQGEFQAVGYVSTVTDRELIALVARRHRRRRGRAGPGAFRMPDRRRPRLAALRLRPAAARRAARGGRRGPRRGAVHPRARGPRDRPAGQAAGLRTAGRRAPTPSTPTCSWACPPTPASTAPARRCWPTWASGPCGC